MKPDGRFAFSILLGLARVLVWRMREGTIVEVTPADRISLQRKQVGLAAEQSAPCDNRIIMVGTPLYRRKYENKETSTGYVVAAEVDVIANRLLGTGKLKASVLPLLLDGEKTASLPPLLHGRVYADFRKEAAYFAIAFDLILSLYQLPPHHPAVADLRESLRGPEMM